MARTVVNMPAQAKRGEVIEIKTLAGHVMETGFRHTERGESIPRDIITQFVCTYNGTEIFSAVGIDLAAKKYIGVKSTNHFYAAYAPIAAKVLYCDGEGPSPLDARKYPFTKARRTIWPHAELPEGRMVV